MSNHFCLGNMGIVTSEEPVAPIPDAYIAISICHDAKIRVMNATPEVKEMLTNLDQEMTMKLGSTRGPLVEHYGTLKLNIGSIETFTPGHSASRSTLGKVFTLRVLEEMHNLGYSFVTSSDLARVQDNATWFFAKSEISKENRGKGLNGRICCIAPSGFPRFNSRLVLLHHDELIKEAVMQALKEGWPSGISGSKDEELLDETVHEVYLKGNWGGNEADGVNTRRTICGIIGRMAAINWRLLTSTNIKGTADIYFFIHDPTYSGQPDDFCILSLGKHDRFRLIKLVMNSSCTILFMLWKMQSTRLV